MNWFSWLNWFNRAKITLLIASLTLVLAATSPWYRLPPDAVETFGTNLWLPNIGRGLAAIFALIGFVFVVHFDIRRIPRIPFWGGLLCVLLFPYLMTTWFPATTFIATAYHNQIARVAQHVEANFPEVQAQWKQNISLGAPSPVGTLLDFSIKDSRFFQMSSWDQFLIEGFGYSRSFFEFIGRGWLLTIFGLFFSLGAIYLGLQSERFNIFLMDIGKLLPLIGLGLGTISLSIIVLPNVINYQLDELLAKGEYHQVLTTSQALEAWYPPLKGDSIFFERMAEASFYEDELSPFSMFFVKGLEGYKSGDLLQAENYFRQALDIQSNHFLTRAYLASTLLELGIKDFNDRKVGSAIDQFEEVLQIFPSHVEGMYDLMLARIVNGQFEQSAQVAQKIVETQQNFQIPSVALLGQAYTHSAWASYHDGDLNKAWKQYRQSVDKRAW